LADEGISLWWVGEAPPPFRLAYTGRWGGVSAPPFARLNLGFKGGDDPDRVLENRLRVSRVLGVPLERWTLLRQVHSAEIVLVKEAQVGAGSRDYPSGVDDADAMVTAVQGAALCVLAADCLPVALMSGEPPAAALVHAGRRGALAGLPGKTVRFMEENLSTHPGEITAWLGPCIGACCYQVSEGIALEFSRRFDASGTVMGEDGSVVRGGPGGPRLDLRLAVRRDLVAAGVGEERILDEDRCTCCDLELFSYRRDGLTGRQAAFVWIDEGA